MSDGSVRRKRGGRGAKHRARQESQVSDAALDWQTAERRYVVFNEDQAFEG